MKKVLSILVVLALIVGAFAGCAAEPSEQSSSSQSQASQGSSSQSEQQSEQSEAKEKLVIANLPKSVGGAWFNRMAVGIEKYGEDTGHETFQTGADKGDAALQVKEVENLITQGVDVITIVPVSPEALEPVLTKAREAGIIVISHEAQGIVNVDYDVEAFDGAAYGAHLMDELAKAMGEEGEYVMCVGSLTARSHMSWAEGAVARQKEAYPNMKCVNEDAFIETNYNQKASQEKAAELMKTYPNLKGMFVTSATDLPGYALAVDEAGKQGQIAVVGNGVPSANEDHLESGALSFLGCWDPADSGYVMAKVGEILASGGTITDGMDLGIDGYNEIKLDGNVIIGQAWRDITPETIEQYYF